MEGVNHPASRDRSAVFAVFFFLTTSLHSGVSVGKNVGGTVKSTPNAESKGGKVLEVVCCISRGFVMFPQFLFVRLTLL